MADDDAYNYAQMGRAALMPGIQYSITVLQKLLDGLQLELAAMQAGEAAPRAVQDVERKRKGRPPHLITGEVVNKPGKRPSGWPDDPEERKREMQRRQRVREQNRKTRERGKQTPLAKALATSARMKSAQKRYWEGLTPRERRARIQKMVDAREAKKKNQPAELAMAEAS